MDDKRWMVEYGLRYGGLGGMGGEQLPNGGYLKINTTIPASRQYAAKM